MSELNSCPNGRPDCDFAEKHELVLASKILRMIEGYSQETRTYPCPKCLRNSIMAIAALLHLEASKIDEDGSVGHLSKGTCFVDAFAETARERMHSIIGLVDFDSVHGKKQLM